MEMMTTMMELTLGGGGELRDAVGHGHHRGASMIQRKKNQFLTRGSMNSTMRVGDNENWKIVFLTCDRIQNGESGNCENNSKSNAGKTNKISNGLMLDWLHNDRKQTELKIAEICKFRQSEFYRGLGTITRSGH